jgi:hypothetical protein
MGVETAATATAMNPLAGAGIVAGGELLESLMGRLFGSGDRKRLRRYIQSLEGQVGGDVFNKGELTNLRHRIFRSMVPEMNKFAEKLSRRGGLDSGAAMGALWDRSYAARSGFDADLTFKTKQMQLARDAQLRNLIFQGKTALA